MMCDMIATLLVHMEDTSECATTWWDLRFNTAWEINFLVSVGLYISRERSFPRYINRMKTMHETHIVFTIAAMNGMINQGWKHCGEKGDCFILTESFH